MWGGLCSVAREVMGGGGLCSVAREVRGGGGGRLKGP
jgi:hypothetical protein